MSKKTWVVLLAFLFLSGAFPTTAAQEEPTEEPGSFGGLDDQGAEVVGETAPNDDPPQAPKQQQSFARTASAQSTSSGSWIEGALGIQVESGRAHTCVLQTDGNVDCYGNNYFRQAEDYLGGDALEISVGFNHACALTQGGNVICWGENNFGQSRDYYGGDAIAIGSGESHNCAVTRSGNLECWGSNYNGQSSDRRTGDVVGVGMGRFHSCAIKTNGNVDCYGWNGRGGAGDYYGGDAVAVGGGQDHTCVLRESGDVSCYGESRWNGVQYSGGDAVELRADRYLTCVRLADLTVDCRRQWQSSSDHNWYNRDSYGDVIGIGVSYYGSINFLRDPGWVHLGTAGSWKAPPRPDPPANFQATPGTEPGTLLITWDPTGETYGLDLSYRLRYTPGPYYWGGYASVDEPSFLHTGLAEGDTATYRVQTCNIAGCSSYAPVFEAKLESLVAPTDLTATPGIDKVHLAWVHSGSSSETTFQVVRADSPGATGTVLGTTSELQFTDTDPHWGRMQYYRVQIPGTDLRSNEVLSGGFDLFPGTMQTGAWPTCDPDAGSNDVDSCNSDSFGFTMADAPAGDGSITFHIDYGDFDRHSDVRCDGGPCLFWLRLNAEAAAPRSTGSVQSGEVVDLGRLEAQDPATGGYLPVTTLQAMFVDHTGSAPSLHLPHGLAATAAQLRTDDGQATFRFTPSRVPGTSHAWDVQIDAAKVQLVAPPTIIVHGWSFSAEKSNYESFAGWGPSIIGRHDSRSQHLYGQDPYAWAGGNGFINSFFDAKQDFRVSAFTIYDDLVEVARHPQGQAAPLSYTGPRNLVGHSMGGMISRYLVEDVIPDLAAMTGLLPTNRAEYPVRNELNQLLNERWSAEGFEPFLARELVSSVAAIGTPHTGSGWAEHYVESTELLHYGLDCEGWSFFKLQWDRCHWLDGYYKDAFGKDLVRHSEWTFGPWYEKGAYRNPKMGHTSVMSDFELFRIKDYNPVLSDLNQEIGAPGVSYFFLAGDVDGLDGDGVVSTSSATLKKTSKACSAIYTTGQVNYGLARSGIGSHDDVPLVWHIQDDVLGFFAGNKRGLCENQPALQAASFGQASVQRSSGPTELSPTPNPTPTPAQATETHSLEVPVDSTGIVDNGTYTFQSSWTSPGGLPGTLAVNLDGSDLLGMSLLLTGPDGHQVSGPASGFVPPGSPDELQRQVLQVPIPASQVGAWQMELQRDGAWTDLPLLSLQYESQHPLDVTVATETLVQQAQTIQVQAPPGSSLTGGITTPTGAALPIALADDGRGADRQAGDGSFGGSITLQEPGLHRYTIRIHTGDSNATLHGAVMSLEAPRLVQEFGIGAPGDMVATTGPGDGEVSIRWTAPDRLDGLTGYRLRASVAGGAFQTLADTPGTSLVHSGLGRGVTVEYQVHALQGGTLGPASRSAQATTYRTFEAPPAPTDITSIRGPLASQITLTWTHEDPAGAPPATSFRIQRTGPDGVQHWLTTTGAEHHFVDEGLQAGQAYTYVLHAVNVAGMGPGSQQVLQVAPDRPGTPEDFTVTWGRESMRLEWNAGDDGGLPTRFNIYRSTGRSGFDLLAQTADLTYLDETTGGARYEYRLEAVNDVGPSESTPIERNLPNGSSPRS